MAFLLGLLGLLWNETTTFMKTDAVVKFGKLIRQPGIINWDAQQRTMVAMDYTNVRGPFGGNENAQRQLANPRPILNTKYQQTYQLNNRNLRIRTVEARLPAAQLLTERNRYQNYHVTEATFQKINQYWKSRKGQINNWQS